METKICACCKQAVSTADFSPFKTSRDGLYSYCRPCARDKARAPAPPPIQVVDGEVWKPARGWEDLYEVSNFGRVKVLKREARCKNRWGDTVQTRPEKLMHPSPTKFGHLAVCFSRGSERSRKLVHRLVAEAFIGPCPTGEHHCAHWDGDPANNKVENLRWATAAENAADTKRHGHLRQGEESNLSRLTEADVIQIRSDASCGKSAAFLAEEYSMTAAGIYKIINRENWKHI